MSAEERAKTPCIDYMLPIIADADTGHGGLGSVMKLAKLFAESVSNSLNTAKGRALQQFIWKISYMVGKRYPMLSSP